MSSETQAKIKRQDGDALYRQGKYEEATVVYERAIEPDPNAGNYENWLKCLERVDADRKRKAIDAVKKAIGNKSEHAYAYYHWGEALRNRSLYAEAIERHEKAIPLNDKIAYATTVGARRCTLSRTTCKRPRSTREL